jgi:hypothetical protein
VDQSLARFRLMSVRNVMARSLDRVRLMTARGWDRANQVVAH